MSMKLLIADDHPLMRAGIRTLLERTLDQPQIFEAVDGHEALEIAATVRPDIVLMDISMPRPERRRRGASTRDRAADVQGDHALDALPRRADRAVSAGGREGYLVKDAAVSEVVSAIDAVQRGEVFITQHASAIVTRMLARNTPMTSPLELLERAAARDSPDDCRRAVDQGNRVSAEPQWQDGRDASAAADAATRDPRRGGTRAIRRSIGSRLSRALRPSGKS